MDGKGYEQLKTVVQPLDYDVVTAPEHEEEPGRITLEDVR
jgi:hypothetical protein